VAEQPATHAAAPESATRHHLEPIGPPRGREKLAAAAAYILHNAEALRVSAIGFGLGTGTSAEGWVFEAIRFWQTSIRRQSCRPAG
jgi:hypothetical protein